MEALLLTRAGVARSHFPHQCELPELCDGELLFDEASAGYRNGMWYPSQTGMVAPSKRQPGDAQVARNGWLGALGLVRSFAVVLLLSLVAPALAGPNAPRPKPVEAPVVTNPGPLTAVEESEGVWPLSVRGAARVFVDGLPPGAEWDEVRREIRFRPDFTQGGRSWSVVLTAWSDTIGTGPSTVQRFHFTVLDTITPPPPRVAMVTSFRNYNSLLVVQDTDDWLDSPGHAGRTFYARVIVPKVSDPDARVPVQINLHGFGARRPSTNGSGDRFRIYPMDPSNTYWWGYAESLPLPTPPEPEAAAPKTKRRKKGSRKPPKPRPKEGTVPPYTQRRVLHLLDWVLTQYRWANPEKVYVQGSSMGGAGALKMGLLRARHFAYVSASVAQAIGRNHRPYRLRQLSKYWGEVDSNLNDDRERSVWDVLDMTWVYMHVPEARRQYVKTRHGKDDRVIHFGAAVFPSSETRRSLYDAFQYHRVGHYAVWDESGHSGWDPVMGSGWSSATWDRIRDPITFLRRDLAFPAFSKSSGDADPGDGGNGQVEWRDGRGFSADASKPGDTGWNGAIAGALNRFLRWDAATIVDSHQRFEVALRHASGVGARAKPGYPAKGDRPDVPLPIVVDVTPRRVGQFRCLPGESIGWSYGTARGIVRADFEGLVTVPRLPIHEAWTRLLLQRL